MRRWLLLWVVFFSVTSLRAQGNFRFAEKSSKTTLPFKFINNLIILPVELNGVQLNFLLDTGVEETILFSLEETKEIAFEHVEKVKLRGLGSQEHIEGLKSTGNKLGFEDMLDDNHMLYIVMDESFNFSSHIGIPVNGIIGYQFFRNNLVEIDYDRRRIIIYHDSDKARRKIQKKMTRVPVTIELRKPYLVTEVKQNGNAVEAKLLIDTGSSDAVWLFEELSDEIGLPGKYFEDFLGRGFSGEVYGKRGRIDGFLVGGFLFEAPIVAFPDSVSIRHVNMVKDRMGSVGGEILKRFSVVFDYPNKQIFLKKAKSYYDPFHYNMSGLEIEHSGLQWIKETVELNTNLKGDDYSADFNKRQSDFHYKFELKPLYSVTSVRPDSPAAEAGILKDDKIISVNGRLAYRYTLQDIIDVLRSEPDRQIVLQLERNGLKINVSFRLRKLL
ncbi:PDZ domain-containing protein [Flavobacterium selenitireducens]|uniref:PDZ domain-containing protein n=1 Tax=Flavobacterium selenitireducens TaxID=2722704 RepID=UPI00168B5033|nr:PDZ domain-containing protein [Flavobacterium selenitireducens]MBD3583784.1 PDZ domain-containing protein [Flavobacterium selenitireducens]